MTTTRSMIANIVTLSRRDLRDALASRWFILYSLAFVALGLCVSYVSASSAGGAGLAGFGRTSAGLVNLVLLVVPLMGLTAGAGSVAGDRERGMLAYLLAQPISRWELLAGKYVALAIALSMSICVGFGVSAMVMSLQRSTADASGYLLLVGLTILLAMSMLSIGMLISVLCRRAAVATGVAVFVWLAMVFATDLGLMAGTIAMKLSIETLFGLAVASPLQVFKMWSLQGVDASLDVLGPAGLYAQTEFGGSLKLLFLAVLAAWTLAPILVAGWVFNRRALL